MIFAILKVSSTISSDTEDDVNSSTEAKGAIGLRRASQGSSLGGLDSGLSSSISSTDSDSTRSKNEPGSSEKNSSNGNSSVILKKVFKPRLSKNAEQIEALLRRINEENKKTKEVLDNISKAGELTAPANPKNQPFSCNNYNKKLVDPQDLIDPEEEEKTKNLVNAVIPPIRTAIIEKTSTTFLGMLEFELGKFSFF